MKYLFATSLIALTILTLGISQKAFALGSLSISNFASTSCTASSSCSQAQQGATELDNGSGLSLTQIIGTSINILAWIIGVVAVIMVIFGGFRFVTSTGDSNSVASARSTIVYALIGLMVAVFAQIILHFVLTKFYPKI
jgi:hypothetical protein